jgi:hypothetical protein
VVWHAVNCKPKAICSFFLTSIAFLSTQLPSIRNGRKRLPQLDQFWNVESPCRVSAFGGDDGSPSLRRRKQEHASTSRDVKMRPLGYFTQNSGAREPSHGACRSIHGRRLCSGVNCTPRVSPRICVAGRSIQPYRSKGRKRAVVV